MLAGTRIRNKLLYSYALLFTLSLSIAFATIYVIVRDTISTNIESELHNTTTSINNLVGNAATASIKNYLRGIAEKNLQIIDSFHRAQQQGLLSEAAAKEQAAAILLSQTIGTSGYIYTVDGNGIVVVHPQKAVLGSDVSEYSFVRDLQTKKRGYLEYDWKNPDDPAARPKALYMAHFAPWDWIISVSAYREEFKGLVNVDDFKKSVLDLQFGRTGYAFIIDGKGKAIIHPKLEGANILTLAGVSNEALATILKKQNGQIVYPWKNPGETRARDKLCIFTYVKDYDWIVGATSYHDEFFEPLKIIGSLTLATFVITMILILTLTVQIGNSITNPLQRLMNHFENASRGDFSQRMTTAATDEIGQLAGYFNRFMKQLADYSNNLKEQIAVRQEAENSMRESEQRYRSVMESAADPIVIYDMDGKVTYFNHAFESVFGWHLEECLSRRMDHFVPEENWPETFVMINTIKNGGILPATETKRYTKSGDIRSVSISGAAFQDHSGNPAGSVIILRDVTETKRLTNLLMDIGDNIRQTIGQDLHDDLCPHLIGIGGLASALQATISAENGKAAFLAEKIIELIDEATAKARGLARGLCPVHLVSYGLQSALNEIADHTRMTANIRCTFNGDESLTFSNNTLATHLYYIVQEAVNNAVKHAAATTITISLTREEGYIHLRITDNGRGIGERQGGIGIGMQLMKYRVLAIGAFLEITSAKDAGTTIHVVMKTPEDKPDNIKG
ncbi:cache domain-containing protein [Desulfoprunum benzoelyticum]|uniref:histidine kinase n=1 Tax=Desulfoprunum benzoelyticum TaxID=1506996 RepID=A0A840V636_9BACT|nr:cache domain-containing protein [Desulfoprunum benzoelyticum]MBB5349219.1 PAS domain S-box-containing protein [Desulfoprunum benzoelyticum]MBM9530850.1 cache domain-containing protein [Desulfoprunum benzoelyticum]